MVDSPAIREKWNQRHSDQEIGPPSSFLVSLGQEVPLNGTALDVAGGTGRNSLWLAARGLRATLVDISDVALAKAHREAEHRGLQLTTTLRDLEAEGLPPGSWDVIVCFHYLHRPLFPQMLEALTPGGVLVCELATVRNLEAHDRPPRRFVLDEGELGALTAGLAPLHYSESWTDEGRHWARFAGRRPAA